MDGNSPFALDPGVLETEDTDDAELMAMGSDAAGGTARRRRGVSLAVDPDGRKHVCYTCGKSFMRPSSLRIHANTHTGAKRECRFVFPCSNL